MISLMSLGARVSFTLLLTAAAASATTLGQASPFNVVSFGSISTTSDIAGRVAVQGSVNRDFQLGGNEIINNFNNYGSAYQSSYTTVLNSGNNGHLVRQLANGNVYSPGYAGVGPIQIQNGTGNIITSGPSPIDWAALYAEMTDLSTYLKTASAYTVTGTTNVVVNTTGLTDNVMNNVLLFRLSATQFANLGSIVTNGKTVLIDIDFKSVMPGGTMNTGNSPYTVDGQQAFANNNAARRVLFNVCPGMSTNACNSSTLNLNVGFYGALLAPATTVQGNSQFNGQMVVGNLNFQGEIHGQAFVGDVPDPTSVPEPSAMVLSGVGLVWVVLRRR